MIPYGKQSITQDDIDAVVSVLESDFLTQGPQVPAFEKALTNATGAQYALAVNSATSALHIACLALGLGKGDVFWTTPITFVASANCGLYCGATVDFVDIDPETYNLCPRKLEQKLIDAEKAGTLPKVVIPVHLCGQPCDMKAIYNLSLKYGFKIIEDASHAIGGRYLDSAIGSCKYSDITVFSFHPVKIITTAEGGAALTNDSELAEKMNLYRSHGVTREPRLMASKSHGPWYYEQVELGYNYRMTELQAALGVSQMARLDAYVLKRNDIADIYDELLADLPISLPKKQPVTYSARHLYVIRLKLTEISKSHLSVFEELRQKGVGVNLHYIPVHTQPFYQRMGFQSGDFPNSEAYYEDAISLPIYQGLTKRDQNVVVRSLREVLEL